MTLLKQFCKYYIFLVLATSFALMQEKNLVGLEAPGFYLSDLDNNDFFLSESLEKPLFINFFATWCSPCIAELEDLKNLHEENKQLINMVIIDETNLNQIKSDFDSRLDIKEALNKYNIPFTVLYDKYAVVAEEFQVIKKTFEINKRKDGIDMPMASMEIQMPSSFIINTKGFVVWQKRGMISKDEFQQLDFDIKRGNFDL